jgi:hypothetical protein
VKLAILLEIDFESIMVLVKRDYSWSRNDEFALKALQAAEEEIKLNSAALKSFETPSTALRRNRYL